MSKSSKYFELFSALKAGGDKGVSPAALQKATGFNQGALAVYIHALRNKFGAQIESVRNGRSVIAYRLTNADEVTITAARKKRVTVAKPAKAKAKKTVVASVTKTVKRSIKPAVHNNTHHGIVAVPDPDLDIVEYTDRELADIQSQLGIG
jgi:hypothetical protein